MWIGNSDDPPDKMDRREFFGRVFGAGGAGLALLFIAGCGGEEDDDDEDDD